MIFMGYALLTSEQTETELKKETARLLLIDLVDRASDRYADRQGLTGYQRENFFRGVRIFKNALLDELAQHGLPDRAAEIYLAARFDRFRGF